MATQLLSPDLGGSQIILSSQLSDIRASTDKEKVEVSLSCGHGFNDEAETFYTTTLYAFNGIVEFSDVATLIESYFRQRRKVIDTITITIDTVTVDIEVLYCEYAMTDSFDPQTALFISSEVRRVHQDSIITLAALDRGADTPFMIKAVGHEIGGNSLAVVWKTETRRFNRENSVCFSVAEIIRWAMNQSEMEAGADLRDVLYFSISYAGKQLMCYIVPAGAYLTFSFRNMFNVEEFIDVAGEITVKTETSRDTAVCNGISRQYNRTVTRTYQVQTEPLTSAEVSLFEQFLSSHEVRMYLDDVCEVIITDHTCEPSSDDDTLVTMKFTWRFAGRQPRMFDNTAINGIMPSRRRIFDEKFSAEYE